MFPQKILKNGFILYITITCALFLNAAFAVPPAATTIVAKKAPVSVPLTLFVSQQCPHCQALERWLKTKQIDTKVALLRKDVIADPNNQRQLIQALKKCGVTFGTVELPILWNGSQCIIGEDAIMQFLQKIQ